MLGNTGAIIDDTVYDADVTVSFAMKPSEAEAFVEKVVEISGGKNCPERIGTRFDAK